MGGYFRKVKFKKGKKTQTKEVTGFELGDMMEKGWKIDEVIEVFDDGVDEEAFHRLRRKIKRMKKLK